MRKRRMGKRRQEGDDLGRLYLVQPDHERESGLQEQNRLLTVLSLSRSLEMNILIDAVSTGKQLRICNGSQQILRLAVCASQIDVFVMSHNKICLLIMSMHLLRMIYYLIEMQCLYSGLKNTPCMDRPLSVQRKQVEDDCCCLDFDF